MKSTENKVWDDRVVSRGDVSRELFEQWSRQSGGIAPTEDPCSDAPSGLFRGVGLAFAVSLVLWGAIVALVMAIL
jgi:hypothetical protein